MLLANIIMTGRVQNIGLRSFMKELADSMSLIGEAHNNYDGSVEVNVYAYSKEDIDKFIAGIKTGYSYASISNMNITITASDPYYKDEFFIDT